MGKEVLSCHCFSVFLQVQRYCEKSLISRKVLSSLLLSQHGSLCSGGALMWKKQSGGAHGYKSFALPSKCESPAGIPVCRLCGLHGAMKLAQCQYCTASCSDNHVTLSGWPVWELEALPASL